MYEEYLKHVNVEVTKEIEGFVYENVLQHSEYAVMRKEGKGVIAYCTRCGQEFEVDEISHNVSGMCPMCGADVISKNVRYGRRGLSFRTLFYTFEKSLISNKHIVCKAYEVWREGYQEYKKVETEYYLKAVYIYGQGESVMLEKIGWYGWNKRSSIFDISNIIGVYWNRINTWIDFDSFEREAKGIPYEYSMLKEIHNYNSYRSNTYILKYLELFTKNNLVESIIKIGGAELVQARLDRKSCGNTVNWRGNTIYKILKIDKADLRELIKHKQYIRPSTLRVYQLAKNSKSKLNMDEIKDIEMKYSNVLYRLEEIIKSEKLEMVYRYLNKQKSKHDYYATHSGALIEFADYINDLKYLGMDIKNKDVLFPRDLKIAHQKTLVQVEVKKDPEMAARIVKRYKTLSKYSFKYKELEIRPVKDIGEIVTEGKSLSHCVGTYSQRHAKGETNIFVIRKINEPDKPFYTVEIKSKKVIQVRGFKNCEATEEVKEFMEKFELVKLSKSLKKNTA